MAGIFFFIASCIVTPKPYLFMLTAAQLIFIPVMLQLLVELKRRQVIFIWFVMLSLVFLQVVPSRTGQMLLALVYVAFTFFVAFHGLRRFFKRGFTNWAEMSIDIG